MNEFFAAAILVGAAFYIHRVVSRVPDYNAPVRNDDTEHDTHEQTVVPTRPPPVQVPPVRTTNVIVPPTI
jgi:hypothetical protein